MKKVLVLGGGITSLNILQTFLKTHSFKIEGIYDSDYNAPGAVFARQNNLPVNEHWEPMVNDTLDIIIDGLNDKIIFDEVRQAKAPGTVMVPFDISQLISVMSEEIEDLIEKIEGQNYQHELMLDLTHDGMIAINCREEIILFNPSAEKMTGLKKEQVMGKDINVCMPSTALPRVLRLLQPEVNQEQVLENGMKIITNRIPMLDHQGKKHGAFAVFRDITDIEQLAEEVTNLKSIQTMLNAIIQSSEEAISVVDEEGKGLIINPAYTRITGLSEKEVIGKPATADIYEGESMHMKVLKTRKPVRGAWMKVGPSKRDVIVNVAPVIVDGKIKGSVGVIHDMSEITSLTRELNRARQIIRTLEAKYTFEDIIGDSEEASLVKDQARLAASTPVSILLRGESGTGKELFAHAIHNESSRKYNKFVRVNCAAISEHLLESEMFGYAEGAFPGAASGGKRGYFEEADGGSIFLDEIGELSIHVQAKLLRVLQEKEIVRVGAAKPVHVDVRIITATNVNLEKRIAEGSFREDLYYRLNRLPIFIPPLRQRLEDIPELSRHLVTKINADYGRSIEEITDEAIEKLQQYDWPGNVRELENVLGRAMIHMAVQDTVIESRHIPELQKKSPAGQLGESDSESFGHQHSMQNYPGLNEQMDYHEKQIIKETLEAFHLNKTKAAEALGISVRNLYYKMEKHHFNKNDLN